ncbi:MAG: hypothetical protein J5842_03055, partial [Lachnospiraceae bacterium]|nr:hypothetical protein [Lachnospiraceae bacterium]
TPAGIPSNTPGADAGSPTQAPGDASGTQVTPGKAVISSVKNTAAGVVTLKFKKADVSGYQIIYARDRKFKKGKKTKKTAKTALKLKKLKKGSTYFIRIRSYTRRSDGTLVYGKWSGIKKIKIKK